MAGARFLRTYFDEYSLYSKFTAEQFLTLDFPLGKSFEYGAKQEVKLAILAEQITRNTLLAQQDIASRLYDRSAECLALFKALIASYQEDNKTAQINTTIKALLVAYKMVIEYEYGKDTSDKHKKAKLGAALYLLDKEVDLTSLEGIQAALAHSDYNKAFSQGRLGDICDIIKAALTPTKKISFNEAVERLNKLKLSVVLNAKMIDEIKQLSSELKKSENQDEVAAGLVLERLNEKGKMAREYLLFFGENENIDSSFFLKLKNIEQFPLLKVFFSLLNGNVQSDDGLQKCFVSYQELTAQQMIEIYDHPLTFAIENKLSNSVQLPLLKEAIGKKFPDIWEAFRKGYFELCFKLLQAQVNSYQLSNQVEYSKKIIQLFLDAYYDVFHPNAFLEQSDKQKTIEDQATAFLMGALKDPQQNWGDIVLRAGFSEHKKALMEGKLGQIFELIRQTFPRTIYSLPILNSSISWELNKKAIEEIKKSQQQLEEPEQSQQRRLEQTEKLQQRLEKIDKCQRQLDQTKEFTQQQLEKLEKFLQEPSQFPQQAEQVKRLLQEKSEAIQKCQQQLEDDKQDCQIWKELDSEDYENREKLKSILSRLSNEKINLQQDMPFLTIEELTLLKEHKFTKNNKFIQTLVMVYEHGYEPEKIRLRTLEGYFLSNVLQKEKQPVVKTGKVFQRGLFTERVAEGQGMTEEVEMADLKL